MSNKANGTKAVAEKTAKVTKSAEKAPQGKGNGNARAARAEFIAKFGERIAKAFASFPKGKATSAGTWKKVFPKAESPQRMTDYCLVALGLKSSKDKGLLEWVKDDEVKPQSKKPNGIAPGLAKAAQEMIRQKVA